MMDTTNNNNNTTPTTGTTTPTNPTPITTTIITTSRIPPVSRIPSFLDRKTGSSTIIVCPQPNNQHEKSLLLSSSPKTTTTTTENNKNVITMIVDDSNDDYLMSNNNKMSTSLLLYNSNDDDDHDNDDDGMSNDDDIIVSVKEDDRQIVVTVVKDNHEQQQQQDGLDKEEKDYESSNIVVDSREDKQQQRHGDEDGHVTTYLSMYIDDDDVDANDVERLDDHNHHNHHRNNNNNNGVDTAIHDGSQEFSDGTMMNNAKGQQHREQEEEEYPQQHQQERPDQSPANDTGSTTTPITHSMKASQAYLDATPALRMLQTLLPSGVEQNSSSPSPPKTKGTNDADDTTNDCTVHHLYPTSPVSHHKGTPALAGLSQLSATSPLSALSSPLSASSSSSRSSSSSAAVAVALGGMLYKSKVRQVMEQMEMSQQRMLQQHDDKTFEFQQRVEQLLLTPGNVVPIDRTVKQQQQSSSSSSHEGKAGESCGVFFRTMEEQQHHQEQEPLDKKSCTTTAKDGTNRTVSTRSMSMSTIAGGSCCESVSTSGVAHNHEEEDQGGTMFVRSLTHPRIEAPMATLTIQPLSISPSSSSKLDDSSVVHEEEDMAEKEKSNDSHQQQQEQPQQQQSGMEQIQMLKDEKDDVECENRALRALRESFLHRFAFEQDERTQLEKRVMELQASLTMMKEQSSQRETDLADYRAQLVTQRKEKMESESNLQRRNERIRRDFDQLWKEYRTLQASYQKSTTMIHDLQCQVNESNKKEQRWSIEKKFMKEKMDFFKNKITASDASRKVAIEEKEKLDRRVEKLEQEQLILAQENRDLIAKLEQQDKEVRKAHRQGHRVMVQNRKLGTIVKDEANETKALKLACQSLQEQRDALQVELNQIGEVIRKVYSM